jgi:hypothetical protein
MYDVSNFARKDASTKNLPAKEDWHIGVNGPNDTPNIHRVPHWERLAGDMGDDYPSDNMRELQSPGAEKWYKGRRVDYVRVSQGRLIQPRNM